MLRARLLILAALQVLSAAELRAESRLPSALLQIPESVTTVFVAETSTAEFHRFDRVGDKLAHSHTYYMSIGKAGPGKKRAGDKGTPLGAYFITEQLDTSRLHEKYGVTAFPLDYPNAWDRLASRTGDGIWLHGVDPNGGRRPELDTDGCIALPNEDLLTLVPQVEEHVTPVLVTETVQWQDEVVNNTLQSELHKQLAVWAGGYHGNSFAFLSLYDDEFQRWGLDKSTWHSLLVQTAASNPVEQAEISDVLLLRYPGEEGLILSRFQLLQTVNGMSVVTNKRLYWRRDGAGAFKIVAESEG